MRFRASGMIMYDADYNEITREEETR